MADNDTEPEETATEARENDYDGIVSRFEELFAKIDDIAENLNKLSTDVDAIVSGMRNDSDDSDDADNPDSGKVDGIDLETPLDELDFDID